MILDPILGWFSNDLAIDLGTANTVVYANSARVGGDKMDEAIINYVKRKYNLLIGERTAELIKINIGSACLSDENASMEVKGRDLVAGVPKILEIKAEEVREALAETSPTTPMSEISGIPE